MLTYEFLPAYLLAALMIATGFAASIAAVVEANRLDALDHAERIAALLRRTAAAPAVRPD